MCWKSAETLPQAIIFNMQCPIYREASKHHPKRRQVGTFGSYTHTLSSPHKKHTIQRAIFQIEQKAINARLLWSNWGWNINYPTREVWGSYSACLQLFLFFQKLMSISLEGHSRLRALLKNHFLSPLDTLCAGILYIRALGIQQSY